MYIIRNRSNLVFLVLIFITSCSTSKNIDKTNLIGTYENKQKFILLDLKSNNEFWLYDKKDKKGCVGKWSLQKDALNLNCKPPPDITFLIQGFEYIQDTILEGKIKENSIFINNEKLIRK